MADPSELSLLQARLQSLERDLGQAQRRVLVRDETARSLALEHARAERAWRDREAELEGRCTVAEQELAHVREALAAATAASPSNAAFRPSATTLPLTPPAALPLRPLLPYVEDSPFFRREESLLASKVTALSSRLKRIVGKAKDFSQATSKFAETASTLATELAAPWVDVEGGLDAILASAVEMQAQQTDDGDADSSSSGQRHRSTRSSVIQTEELVSLSSAFGKLSDMLSTVSDIGVNLSMSTDAFLVRALTDFRGGHVQAVIDKGALLNKAKEEYESAFAKRLNKKRERSTFSGITGIVTDKQRKKAAQEEEEVRSLILVCSSLRKNYELLRFDYATLINEVLLERRAELIEMVCASFLAFSTYFHAGHYQADLIKGQVDVLSKLIHIKRPLFAASQAGIKDQRVLVEKALELVVGGGGNGASAVPSSPGGSASSPLQPSSTAPFEKVLNWRVKDAFPTSYTASGLMSPAAQAQQEQGQVLLPNAGGGRRIPSPYAHAVIRGVLVPIEREGWLRKQSSSLKKDFKMRWFVLQGGSLFYVRDAQDINPVHVQEVLLCTVRAAVKSEFDLTFSLISPTKREYTLQAETEESMQAWMACFQNCSEALLNASGNMLTAHEQGMSSSQLKQHTDAKTSAVQQLRKLNPTCAECGARDPDWSVINLGILICIDCSGVHRSLGTSISKVRSIALDSWTTELLDLMLAMGNAQLNELYEGSLQAHEEGETDDGSTSLSTPKPTPTSSREVREEFINLKYSAKTFLCKGVLSQAALDPRQHAAEFLEAASKNDIKALMTLLSLGVAVDCVSAGRAASPEASATVSSPFVDEEVAEPFEPSSAGPSASPTSVSSGSMFASPLPTAPPTLGTRALHVAARCDHILALELLLQNNARETLKDENGRTPADVAQEYQSARCLARLTANRSKR